MSPWCPRPPSEPRRRPTRRSSRRSSTRSTDCSPRSSSSRSATIASASRGEPGRFDRVFGGQTARPGPARGERHGRPARTRTRCTPTSSRPASPGEPLELAVDRVRDGRSISTRRVTVMQGDRHAAGRDGLVPRQPRGPRGRRVPRRRPAPDAAPRAAGLGARPAPALRRHGRQLGRPTAAARPAHRRAAHLPRRRPRPTGTRSHWMRLPAHVGDDPLLHTALLAYASDYLLLDMAFRSHPERRSRPARSPASASTTPSGSTARCASTAGTSTPRRRSPSRAIAAWCAARSTTPTGTCVATVDAGGAGAARPDEPDAVRQVPPMTLDVRHRLFEQPWPEGEYRLFQLGFVVDDLLAAAGALGRACSASAPSTCCPASRSPARTAAPSRRSTCRSRSPRPARCRSS